ncbi:MAG: hypothetical protein JWM33_1406 [Caulobacteraceae bacterium]|nr:hypothetical protein [Caulobacteraceae bacterium]
MKLNSKGAVRLASGAFAAALMCGAATGAFAQAATQGDIATLKAQIQALTDQVNALSTANDTNVINISALQTPTQGVTTATLPNGKPAFVTGDKRFSANIRAVAMFDAAHYDQDTVVTGPTTDHTQDLNDGTNFRRARLGIDGKLFNDFDYSMIYEFGGSGTEDAGHLQEAWVQFSAWKPWNGKVLTKFKLGAYEPNAGLSAATSTGGMPFIERSSPAEIARNFAAGDSRSAFQITANGDLGSDSSVGVHWLANAAVTGNVVSTVPATFLSAAGGAVGSTQPFDEQLGYLARVAVAPFSGQGWLVHAGASYQYVVSPNDLNSGANSSGTYNVQLRDRPELRVDGTRLIDTGGINSKNASVVGYELAGQYKNFLIEAEDFKYKLTRVTPTALPNPDFDGYYVAGSWVLTGEPRAYDAANAVFAAPKPNNNFAYGGSGAIGAWELVARYSDTNLNYRQGVVGSAAPTGAVRGGEQKISTVGLNWFPNPTLKFMLDYQDVKVDRIGAGNAQVGQEYNAVAFRSQISF